MRVAQGSNVDDFDFRIEGLERDDLKDLAAGLVPNVLRAQAMSLLDYEDHFRRNSLKESMVAGQKPKRRKAK